MNNQFPLSREDELKVKRLPRYQKETVRLFGRDIVFPDSASLAFLLKELFAHEIYKFKSDTDTPFIIDCGANIGLSVIYFKRLYPEAKIVAFEPDEKIFACLEFNIASFGFADVELVNKGLWDERARLAFYSEGADGGRVKTDSDVTDITLAEMTLLGPYLDRDVDFLKMDIEGAEARVLAECQQRLGRVKNIFVEYHSFSGQPQTLSRLLNILEQSGFRYYIEHVGVTSGHPLVKRESYGGFDNQLNIFGYRA